MRVYVETNFVLELVLEQAECPHCERLLDLARASEIVLAIPAIAMAEPFATLRRRRIERANLKDRLDAELRELRRTKSLAADAASSQLAALLIRSAQRAEERFRDTRHRLLDVATVLPLDAPTIDRAESLGGEHALSFPDALVLASVLQDPEFGHGASCFLNRNTKDFEDPAIIDVLRAGKCRVLGSFGSGVRHIEASIVRPSEP